MLAEDEWFRAAMTDDMVVVELLLRLKQTQAASASLKSQLLPGSKVLRGWALKQPRSKAALPASKCDGALSRRKDATDSIRFSPTTPFSWSGGASPSAITDGFEESSRPLRSARSKATATGKFDSNIANTKSSRRRKTFAERKDVECSLLEERIYLRKEVDTLHAPLKARKATNQSLKRIKLDVVQDAEEKASTASASDCRLSKFTSHWADSTPSSSCDTRQTNSTQESSFLLPDLNMMPPEDDSPPQTLYGMS